MGKGRRSHLDRFDGAEFLQIGKEILRRGRPTGPVGSQTYSEQAQENNSQHVLD